MGHIHSKTILAALPMLAWVCLPCLLIRSLGARQSQGRLWTKGREKEVHCASSHALPLSLLPFSPGSAGGHLNSPGNGNKAITAGHRSSCRAPTSCSAVILLRRAMLYSRSFVLSCSHSFPHNPSIRIQEGDGFQGEKAQMLGNPGRRLI